LDTYRIKMKIGVHEFEAEGPTDLVTTQFDAFMAAVSTATALQEAAGTFNLNPPITPAPHAPPIAPATASEVTEAVLGRVFRQSDILSLAALPNGDNATADAMLALLYGYLKLKGETTVTGTSLMKSAKLSGVPVGRVDRAMNQPEYVLAAGVRKARRYQLNNRGIARAEEIIRTILQ
jgi:hypothetical protein